MLHYLTVPVTAFQQNCSFVWCDRTGDTAVIDPGGDVPRLEQAMRQAGIVPSRLQAVWLTHAHIDHAGAAGQLARRGLGGSGPLPVIGPHEGDRFWIDALVQQSRMFGFPAAEPFLPTRWLNDGDELTLGECTLQVRHCPGHTPGHVVFHSAAARRCFVGDVLFAGGIGRTDFPGGDFDTLVASITQRLWPMGDDTVFIPGHGPESSFGQERRHNPFVGGT